ncbi:MAG TPA: oligosaccharide flippase family protein [Rugosimonospora sp.]|nr:oligosaccharide flippase family protein [Rugosimonospora sp.]
MSQNPSAPGGAPAGDAHRRGGLAPIWNLLTDRLVRGSALLLLATVELAAGGFLYWQVVAHRFGPADIGEANALVSASVLIGGLALLGMHNSVIRFLNAWPDRAATINTALTVVAVAAAGTSAVFVAGSEWFAPRLAAMLHHPATAALFTLSTCGYALCLVNDNVFVALGRSGFILSRNTVIVLLRLGLPLLLGAWGAIGVFTAYQVPVVFALLVYLVILGRRLGLPVRPVVCRDRVAAMWRYSVWNYLATLILTAPSLIMPIMVAERIDATNAGYYTIASLLASVLAFVPQATSRSFFAEAMRDRARLRVVLGRVIRLTAAAQIPLLLVLVVGGRLVLRLFGTGYPAAYPLLLLLATTQALTSVGFVGSTLLMIVGRLRLLCVLSAVASSAALASAYLLIGHGLIFAGWSLLVGEAFLVVSYVLLIRVAFRGGLGMRGAAATQLS